MTQSSPESHGAGSPAAMPFSTAEVEVFAAEDRTAAMHIVGLMLSIFLMGVVGYSVVALWCNGNI